MFPEAPVPRRIGDYQVVRRLRADGPIEVFLAREEGPLGFGRDVTLRCVRRDGDDALYAAELAREARVASRLNHPAIVRVLGFLAEGERFVLVLEHVEGTSLGTVLDLLEARGERLPDAAAVYVASTIAQALAAAHAHVGEDGKVTPVLHRAVSPKVVNVARDGTVKLAGFGVAKILDRTPDSAVGLVRGAAGHLAPEQVRGQPATAKTDVWALGLLCFRLFGGPAATRSDSVLQILAGRPPSLTSIREGVPRELAAAVDASLVDDPSKRSIDAAELAKWIGRIAPLEEGRTALRAVMETIPIDEGEPAAQRQSSRKVRAMERRAAGKMNVLRSSLVDLAKAGEEELDDDGDEGDDVEVPDEPVEEKPSIPAVVAAARPASASAPAIPRIATPARVATPARIATPPVVAPLPPPAVEPGVPLILPHLPTRPGTGRRAATMMGVGPVVPKTEVSPPEPAPPPGPMSANSLADAQANARAMAATIASIADRPKPALASRRTSDPDRDIALRPSTPIVITAPPAPTITAQDEPKVVLPSPALPYGARPNPPLEATAQPLDETSTSLHRVEARRSRSKIVAGVIAAFALLGIAGAAMALRGRATDTATDTATESSATSPATAASAPKSAPTTTTTQATKATVDVAPAPSGSAKTVPSPIPSVSPSASGGKLTPPNAPLPKEYGWLFVHSVVPGRVFVAGRARGEPNKTIAVPCGKLYVNLAKVDSKGTWRGWAAKGKISKIPCDGSVGEVTLED